MEELIRMAKDMKKVHEEEGDLVLNEDEIAFNDAPTSDQIVKDLMDDETLKKIAQLFKERSVGSRMAPFMPTAHSVDTQNLEAYFKSMIK